MHYSCAKGILERHHIVERSDYNERIFLKFTDAIMSSQLREFERFSRYGFVGHLKSLTSQMQSIPSIPGNGNVIRY